MAEKKDFVVNVRDVKEEKTESNEPPPQKKVNKYVLWSMGAALIPVPLLDLGAVAGIQLKMLHYLSQHYGVKFKKNVGKSIIATLTGTLTTNVLKGSVLTSFIKSIPLVGIIGSASMPIYSGAATYAIGRIFIQHFESGGTFLNFDPQKVKDHFAKLYEEGQKIATDLKAEKVT